MYVKVTHSTRNALSKHIDRVLTKLMKRGKSILLTPVQQKIKGILSAFSLHSSSTRVFHRFTPKVLVIAIISNCAGKDLLCGGPDTKLRKNQK